ncbi:MAG: Neutral/alkaline non-lysosomal ceramidase [Planctomycetes bacterium ADurb.Bin126]|nr:MAG: Neutral/alkaline non-lysosomal ceramidase [Planctomycetes bacterium ADurb.Bin126]HOD81053.1 neutral/alkaline non-lysosomal ceramidase N-terminal domain-containing protein [Phycisphaerae bacterium]HQL75655.1 neutral/alkaline non-lysosomal ceramidase N-terminal domain-containing protein [Phycisphaerae bacterium]
MSGKAAAVCLVLLAACQAIPAADAPQADGPLLGGLAAVDITPPVPYRMSGYFHERLSDGVLDPLRAKAMVLAQGGRKLAIVSCDVIALTREITDPARKRIAEALKIPPANVLISATHTHTGPLYMGVLRDYFHQRAVDKTGSDDCEKDPYPPRLIEGIVQAVTKAHAALKPVRLEAGSARQEGLSFNRRFHMQDGSVVFNPGVLNPRIVRPAGPIDPQVGIVLCRDAADGKALGGIVNFALHLDTTGGTKYSADYPHYLEQSLRRTLGEQFVCLYGTGTCGDINHIDVTRRERLTAERIGATLADTVAAKTGSLGAVHADLAAQSRTIELPLPQFTDEQIDQARADMPKVGTRELPFLGQVEACRRLAVHKRGAATMKHEVQVLRLGRELAVVGLPGEVFVELGQAVKKASPFQTTLVIELAQDCPAYVPTRKAFAEGSYETVNTHVTSGGGERLAETACELLKQAAKQ